MPAAIDLSKYTDNLSQIGTDRITGITGVITQVHIFESGNVQYAIQPKSEDGSKLPDAWSIDAISVAVTYNPDLADLMSPVVDETQFNFGDKVECTYSGYKGIVDRKCIHMNGCVSFRIVPKYDPKNGTLSGNEPFWLSHTKMKVIKASVVEPVQNPVHEKTKERAGGPSERAPACC